MKGIEEGYELPREAEDDVWSLTERERKSLGIEPLPQEPLRRHRDRRELRAAGRDPGRARLRLLPAQQARGVGGVPRPGLRLRARPDAAGPVGSERRRPSTARTGSPGCAWCSGIVVGIGGADRGPRRRSSWSPGDDPPARCSRWSSAGAAARAGWLRVRAAPGRAGRPAMIATVVTAWSAHALPVRADRVAGSCWPFLLPLMRARDCCSWR